VVQLFLATCVPYSLAFALLVDVTRTKCASGVSHGLVCSPHVHASFCTFASEPDVDPPDSLTLRGLAGTSQVGHPSPTRGSYLQG
jgi:hypothetical protein